MKIFCIGLPRTGTLSLHEALKTLGLRSIHFPHDDETVRQIRSGDYRLTILDSCDVVSDIPIPAIFPQLDEEYPGSKFILTYRDCESWIRSHQNVKFNRSVPPPGSTRDFYRAMLYGVTEFNERRFRWVFDDHLAKVDRYFAGREEDLLRMNVIAGEGWEKLCAFLNKPIPAVAFPHRNLSDLGDDDGSVDGGDGRIGRLLRSLIGRSGEV